MSAVEKEMPQQHDGPLVSVVFPCYNAAAFLRESLDSIVNQTYRNLEIIILDDGSTDDTVPIIKEYAARDPRIVFHKNPENKKLIYTLNRGIDLATGKYIARMDADDISMPDRIEKLVDALERNPMVDFISSGFYIINTAGKVIYTSVPKALSGKPLKFVCFFSTPLLHPGLVIKSDVLKKARFSTEFIHCEDYELFSRLILSGYVAANLNEPLLYYRANPESVSNQYERIQINSHSRISTRNIENYFQFAPEYFVHKVMIFRIAFSVKFKMLKEALKMLEDLRVSFIQRENCTTEESREIYHFMIEQQIDIIFQAIKHSSLMRKIPLVFYLLTRGSLVSNKRGYRYLMGKIGHKTTVYRTSL